MKILAVYLAQEDVEHDIFLNLIPVADDSYECIFNAIQSRYDMREKSFEYYPPDYDWDNTSGSFTAIYTDMYEDWEIAYDLKWEYTVREI